MSTIKVLFKDDSTMESTHCKGGGPVGESWFAVHQQDDTQVLYNNDDIVSVSVSPDMGDKMGVHTANGPKLVSSNGPR